MNPWLSLTVCLLLICLAPFKAGSADQEPEREMLQVLELLERWEILKNIEMLTQMEKLGLMEPSLAEKGPSEDPQEKEKEGKQ